MKTINKIIGRTVLAGALVGLGMSYACDKINNSDVVQNMVKNQYEELNEKSYNKIKSHTKGIKSVFVPKGIGYLDIIDSELDKKDSRLKSLKAKHGWKNEEIIDAYRKINGDLDYGRKNNLINW